jgi:hypothetical protein
MLVACLWKSRSSDAYTPQIAEKTLTFEILTCSNGNVTSAGVPESVVYRTFAKLEDEHS